MSDAAGLDVSCIAMVAVIGGYCLCFLGCGLWGFLVRLYVICIVIKVFQSILFMDVLQD